MLSTLLLASSLALGVLGQAATSVHLFLGPQGDRRVHWEASVIGVDDACMTTYGLTCTQGKQCSGGLSATITEGNGLYQFSTVTASGDITQSVSERCSLAGTKRAACTVQLTATSGTSTKTTSTASVFRGHGVVFGQVPVTAGASLLASGTCSTTVTNTHTHHTSPNGATPSGSASSGASSSGAAPSMSSSRSSQGSGGGESGAQSTSSISTGGAALPTSLSSVYKVLVVPAAALLALA